jgi:hypothetical protein
MQGQLMADAQLIEGRPAIVVDKEGNWFYNGLPIINRQIVLYFYEILESAPGGGYQLRTEREICPVAVQDTPFVVVALWRSDEHHEQFMVKLNDDTMEPLDLKTLSISAENIPYCTVKQGRFRARFLRAPYYRLAESVQQEDETRFFIELNGTRHYLCTV